MYDRRARPDPDPSPQRDGVAVATGLVSVVMPTYERPDLLRLALDSALAQELTDIEILIGDNSDSDATEQLVAGYDDDRIRYYRHRPGIGAQPNWVDLVDRARGELIATLHDDDLWDPAFLETVVPPMLADPSIAMTFSDYWIIDIWGNRLQRFTDHESARTHRMELDFGRLDYDRAEGLRMVAVWNAPQPAYAAVVRRDDVLACDFPDAIAPLYDIWLSYQLVSAGKGLRYERRRLTSYRIHGASATSGGFSAAEDEVFGRIIADNLDLPEVVDEIRQYWAELRWSRATRLMNQPTGQGVSRRELAAAAPDLSGLRRVAAQSAARSELAWNGLRLLKAFRHDEHGVTAG